MKTYRIVFDYDNIIEAESEHDALVHMLETLPENQFHRNIIEEIINE